MRRLATAERVRAFLRALGRSTQEPATVFLVGGATAVLTGWRDSTVDIDLKLVPDRADLLRAIARLKDELETNVELASPDLFIPVAPGWMERSPWVSTEGAVTVRHFDLVAQALAKIERGHERDLGDVAAMLDLELVDRAALIDGFADIEPELYRYPAVDPAAFRAAVERLAR